MSEHPRAELSAYFDGELVAGDRARIEQHLRDCTECSRELAIMNDLGGVMRTLSSRDRGTGVWAGVHRRITRPIGWILLLAGLAIWLGLALRQWLREELTLEWAAASSVGLGLLMLLVGIAYEQVREWKETRYRDVER